jgi:hypothetical protein
MAAKLRTRHRLIIILSALAALSGLVLPLAGRHLSGRTALAATPASGTISPSSSTVAYVGGPFDSINQTGTSGVATDPVIVCSPASPCDDYALTVSLPAGDTNTYILKTTVSWTSKATIDADANDFDVYIYDSQGQLVQTAATTNNPEAASITIRDFNYKIRVVPFDVNTGPNGDTYSAVITLTPVVGAPGFPSPAPTVAGVPRYQNYTAPNGFGTTAGEPSIGVDWATGKVFISSTLQTLRVTFDDCSSPAKATWDDKSAPTSAESLDPILFTDHAGQAKDRTFVSQLTGQDSLTSFTDDDGDSWNPSQGGGVPSGVDHQSLGGGPYRTDPTALPPVVPPPHPLYPNAIYYCSQDIAASFCARSDNGGVSFGAGVPIYNLNQCTGIHGHVKVAPDGTAYVPNRSCSGKQGFAVSHDNGVTWSVVTNPASTESSKLVDPSIGIGKKGTVYYSYQSGADAGQNSLPKVAVARLGSDGTTYTWSNDQVLGAEFGLKNATFPEAISSAFNPSAVDADDNRAAVAFLGTTAPGDYTQTSFNGTWHLFISTTFDGGVTWNTVDATPNDPVQRGSICNLGTTACNHTPDDRNLLDFMDMTIDRQGRVLVGYPDGCVAGCVNGTENSFTRLASIARQSGGKRLIAAFDPVEPVLPGAPSVTAFSDAAAIHLTWQAPDNGGSPITGYKIYRRPQAGTKILIANFGNSTAFDDLSAAPGVQYFYTVTAANAIGEGPFCTEAAPIPLPAVNSCSLPGASLVTDPTGDASPPTPGLDIQGVSVAEPFDPANPTTDRLVWTMKVASLATVPPNSQWYIIWDFGKGLRKYVAMKTNAAGTPSYEYGHIGPPLAPTNPDPDANKPFPEGAADAGSMAADGTIRITIANSKVADTTFGGGGIPKRGATLANISPRTFSGTGNTNVVSSSATDLTANTPVYTLLGANFCRPQTAPVPQLIAVPNAGPAPLTVDFNGAGSFDPDSGDAIASYTFDFGDTNIVTQSTPTISHTYNADGPYTARLFVKDTRGKLSDTFASATIIVGSTTPPMTFGFGSDSFAAAEGCTGTTITVVRSGANTTAATVDYSTTDGSASQRTDYELAAGHLVFSPGETTKTFKLLITDDGYAEGAESLTLSLSNATGGVTLGADSSVPVIISDNDSATSTTANVIDVPAIFVCQHYHDFLNRQGDPGGQDFWTGRITVCGSDAACIQRQRIGVSAQFFIELEFQQTGFYLYRLYKSALGRRPTYAEFITDRSRLQGSPSLPAEQIAYVADLVLRGEFTGKYSSATTAAAFVDAVIQNVNSNSGVDLTPRRSELIGEYNAGSDQADSRARTLRKLVEYDEFKNGEFNRGFVLSQYFNYLRRDPDTNGFNFWVANLNNDPSNFRGMVCNFITSFEYQERFGPAHTHSNAECSGSP